MSFAFDAIFLIFSGVSLPVPEPLLHLPAVYTSPSLVSKSTALFLFGATFTTFEIGISENEL